MAKFDYVKWVTENKYGKINEQTLTGSVTGSDGDDTGVQTSQTWYQPNYCSPCPPGYVISGSVPQEQIMTTQDLNDNLAYYQGCGPTQEGSPVQVPLSVITSNNPGNVLTANETSLYSQEFTNTFGSNVLIINPNAGYQPSCDLESQINIFQGVCCDGDAENYGQTNLGNYNIQIQHQNALDTSLMLNLYDQAFCDNSLCTGTAVPGGPPVDAMAPLPDKGQATPTKAKSGLTGLDFMDQMVNRRNQEKRNRDRLRENLTKIIKKELNSLKKQKLNEQDVVIDTCYACFTSISFFNPNSPSFNQSAYDELLPMVDMETGLISGQGTADGNFGLCNVTLSYGANSNIGTQGSFNPSSNAILPCSPPLPSPTPDTTTMGGVKPGTPNFATPMKGSVKPKIGKGRGRMRE